MLASLKNSTMLSYWTLISKINYVSQTCIFSKPTNYLFILLIVVVVVVIVVVYILYPWHTPFSFSKKSHNSALVTGSDKVGLFIQPTMVEQYEL